MLRNCLLYEETHTNRLVLGAGVLREWLDAGQRLSIGPAPTSWGPVTLSIENSKTTATVQWEGQWFKHAPEMEVRLPGVEPVVVASGESASVEVSLV